MNERMGYLIACVRAALNGHTLSGDVGSCIELAYRHGVTNLLYYAASHSETAEALRVTLKQHAYASVLREVAQQELLEEIYRKFEVSKIRCVALKGIVLKSLYPKPEMRYMSDIDILIDPSKAALAREILENLGCTTFNYECGDTDSYRSREGLNLEIKNTLQTENFNPQTEAFLGTILDRAVPMQNMKYVCSLPNEEHYAYVLCHIVKHMLCGGVGIRPIMDVWICRKHMQMDAEKLSKLLEGLKLTEFARTVEHLAEVWFGDAEATPLDDELGEYILSSGSFGTEERRALARMMKGEHGKSKFAYMWKRFFLPYKTMRGYYPILKKWAILLPFFWIYRAIYALLFRRGKLKEEVGAVGAANQQLFQNRLNFYRRCGINTDEK